MFLAPFLALTLAGQVAPDHHQRIGATFAERQNADGGFRAIPAGHPTSE